MCFVLLGLHHTAARRIGEIFQQGFGRFNDLNGGDGAESGSKDRLQGSVEGFLVLPCSAVLLLM
jgi:hypothetical protein